MIARGSLVRIRAGGKVYAIRSEPFRAHGRRVAYLRPPFLSNPAERHPDAARRVPDGLRAYPVDELLEVEQEQLPAVELAR